MALSLEEIRSLTKDQINTFKKILKDNDSKSEERCEAALTLGQCYEFGLNFINRDVLKASKYYSSYQEKNYIAKALYTRVCKKLAKKIEYPIIDPQGKQFCEKIITEAKAGRAESIYLEAFYRFYGLIHFPRDREKALELLAKIPDFPAAAKLKSDMENPEIEYEIPILFNLPTKIEIEDFSKTKAGNKQLIDIIARVEYKDLDDVQSIVTYGQIAEFGLIEMQQSPPLAFKIYRDAAKEAIKVLCNHKFSGIFSSSKDIPTKMTPFLHSNIQAVLLAGHRANTFNVHNIKLKSYNLFLQKLHTEAKNGSPECQYYLGWCYIYGVYGLRKDLHKGKNFIELASQKGFEPAVTLLKTLTEGKRSSYFFQPLLTLKEFRNLKASSTSRKYKNTYKDAFEVSSDEASESDSDVEMVSASDKDNYIEDHFKRTEYRAEIVRNGQKKTVSFILNGSQDSSAKHAAGSKPASLTAVVRSNPASSKSDSSKSESSKSDTSSKTASSKAAASLKTVSLPANQKPASQTLTSPKSMTAPHKFSPVNPHTLEETSYASQASQTSNASQASSKPSIHKSQLLDDPKTDTTQPVHSDKPKAPPQTESQKQRPIRSGFILLPLPQKQSRLNLSNLSTHYALSNDTDARDLAPMDTSDSLSNASPSSSSIASSSSNAHSISDFSLNSSAPPKQPVLFSWLGNFEPQQSVFDTLNTKRPSASQHSLRFQPEMSQSLNRYPYPNSEAIAFPKLAGSPSVSIPSMPYSEHSQGEVRMKDIPEIPVHKENSAQKDIPVQMELEHDSEQDAETLQLYLEKYEAQYNLRKIWVDRNQQDIKKDEESMALLLKICDLKLLLLKSRKNASSAPSFGLTSAPLSPASGNSQQPMLFQGTRVDSIMLGKRSRSEMEENSVDGVDAEPLADSQSSSSASKSATQHFPNYTSPLKKLKKQK